MTHTHRSCRFLSLAFLALLIILSGCEEKTTIVLLPDPDGKVGQVVVSTDTQSMDMTRAGEALTIKAAVYRRTDGKYSRTKKLLPNLVRFWRRSPINQFILSSILPATQRN